MRYIGIDYGRKRIGIALSDPLGITAQPEGMIPADGKTTEAIARIIQDFEVTEIVIGYPRLMNGDPGPMAKEVEKFGDHLKEKFSLPLHYWNERLSSAESERLLISANVRREKRKEVRDIVAAAIILQGFLNSKRPHE